MNRTGNIALAVGVGYVLGRKRKLRAALLLGAAAASGQLGKLPGGRLLGGSHGGADGGGADGGGQSGPGAVAKLGGAGRAAAQTALGRPVEALVERLNASAEALRRGSGSGGDRS